MVRAAAASAAVAAALAVAAAIVAPVPLQPATDTHANLSAGAHADAQAPPHAGSTAQPAAVDWSRPPQPQPQPQPQAPAQPPVVASSWGPKRDPLYIVVPITVIYAVIFLTGIVGNISTCIVISRNKHMHTATNYYLFSLAVSDLLLLVSGLPPETYHMWSRYPYVFGETFCVLQGFAAETSSNATVLTITAFTVERYVAICHPFQSHAVSKPSRAVKYILLIWLLALCLAVPQAMAFGLVLYEPKNGHSPNPELTTCTVKRVVIPYAFQISTCVFFVAPMTLISVLYVLIGLQLRRSSVLSRRDASGSVRLKTHKHHQKQQQQQQDGRKNYPKNTHSKATRHVVKMLVAVVVAFFICWAPFHAQRLLAIYGESPTRSPLTVVLYNALTYVSGVLYYLSTTVNPLLYHIMSHKFREAFKDTLARYLGRRRNREGRWRCYSVLSGRSSNTSSDLSRRPLVVSFRKPCHKQVPDPTCRRPITIDGDPAVEFLQRGRDFSSGYRDVLPQRGSYHYHPHHAHHQHHPPHSSFGSLRTASYYSGLASAGHGVASGRDDETFVTVCDSDVSDRFSSSQVQCAADVEPPYLSARDSVARLEDIEIFREERCTIQRCRRTDRLSKQTSDSSDSSKGGSAPVAQGVAPKKPRSEPQSEGPSSANELEFGLRRSATTPNFCVPRRGADEEGFSPRDRRALLEVAKRNLREAVAANEFRLLCQRCRNEMRADDFYEVPYRALANDEGGTAAAETQTVSPIASGDITSDPASDAEPFVSLHSADDNPADDCVEDEGLPLAVEVPDDGQSAREETPSFSAQLTATSSTDTEGSVPLLEFGQALGIRDVDVEVTTPAVFV